MEFLTLWLAFALIDFVATLSPGPAFAMTVRIAVANSRKIAVIFALGLGVGIAVQVATILLGMGVVIAQSILLFNLIKYAGAAYLVYIGIKGLKSRKRKKLGANNIQIKPDLSLCAAFCQGVITNVLNPKAVVFFTAVYAQFISPETTQWQKLVLGSTSVCFEILWFSTLAVFLTNPAIKAKFMSIVHWIERTCGGLLVTLGVKLAISKV